MGFSGPIGLDYSVIPTVLRIRAVKRCSWPDLFDDLQLMEAEVLTMFAQRQKEK